MTGTGRGHIRAAGSAFMGIPARSGLAVRGAVRGGVDACLRGFLDDSADQAGQFRSAVEDQNAVIGQQDRGNSPGHTAGTVSLLAAARLPPVLVGDLTYRTEILQRGPLPGVGALRRLAESTRQVLAPAEQQPGLVMLPAHDPTAARRRPDS